MFPRGCIGVGVERDELDLLHNVAGFERRAAENHKIGFSLERRITPMLRPHRVQPKGLAELDDLPTRSLERLTEGLDFVQELLVASIRLFGFVPPRSPASFEAMHSIADTGLSTVIEATDLPSTPQAGAHSPGVQLAARSSSAAWGSESAMDL